MHSQMECGAKNKHLKMGMIIAIDDYFLHNFGAKKFPLQ